MSRDLPDRPNLEHLKKEAKARLRALRQANPRARLADAQHALARDYGFASWARLKAHVESAARPTDPVTAVIAAVKANDASRVADLLERHPELKRRLNDPFPGAPFGATPLLACLELESRDMIDVLLAAGADINQKSHWWAGGFGVLDHAAEPGRPAWLAPFLIERGAIVDAHAATRLGMMDRLDALVSADPAQVHARGGDGQTPLHVAPTVAIATYLLDHGADIDARDVDHEGTPAQWMVRDRQDVARYLVSRGARTDILMAAALGDVALVERHLAANPDAIRVSVNDTWFPKRDPRAGGHIYIWTLGHDQTPHTVAREFGHDEVFRLLMARSPAPLRLALACEAGDERTCNEMVQAHPDISRQLTDADRRRIADAAHNNNAVGVRLMLAVGWPVDARGTEGGTPLHWAAFHGNADLVRDMLRYHPPVDARGDRYNAPPIGWAVYGSVHGWHPGAGDYARTVELLLEAGATAPPLSDDLEASEPVRTVLRKRQPGG